MHVLQYCKALYTLYDHLVTLNLPSLHYHRYPDGLDDFAMHQLLHKQLNY